MTRRRSRLGTWWWEARYWVGPNLWAVPFGMAGVTAALFAVTRSLDARVAPAASGWARALPEWLLVRNAVDANVMLSAFLSALATTLALVFSISVLTFSLASSQMGPRLIRRFILDPVTQLTLGAYLSAILMCSLTLGSVSTSRTAGPVPEVSYALAVLMSLACFFMLIVYVHRVAVTIQVPHVVAAVVGELDRTMAEAAVYLPDLVRSDDADHVEELTASARSDGAVVVAERSGYLQGIDHPRLLDAAEQSGSVIVMAHRVGQFVVVGQPLAHVVPPTAATAVRRALHEAVEIGAARTRNQDIEFALNQVVEIGLRALSPAINDTFTGRTCVDWLGASLVRIGTRPDPTGGLCGVDGSVRVVEPPLRFDRLLRNAFDLLRQAGSDNPAISIRMFDALATLARTVDPMHLPCVRAYADAVLESATAGPLADIDRADVVHRHAAAVAAVEDRRAAA
mgnify:CR=1 FL=1